MWTSVRTRTAVLAIVVLTAGCGADRPPGGWVVSTPGPAAPSAPSTAVEPIDDAEAASLMAQLLDARESPALAIDRIVGAHDQRFVAVFIELMRAGALDLLADVTGDESDRADRIGRFAGAAEVLTGQALGSDWPAWVEWYGASDLVPPPGFLAWKGELFARIDPRFRDFFKPEHASLIRVEEILWGGVRVDGIPALMNAPTLAAADAVHLTDFDPVFGLEVGGEARAYPLRIMDWHEMANDVVGGVPISLSYCTLCGAAIAYDGRASDGKTYTFGSSGLLYASNKLMYDHQTRTLWNQFTGEPVQGPLVNSRVRLKRIPVVMTGWPQWRQQHPDTTVLSYMTGYIRPYELGQAYGDYFASPDTMFPVWQRSDRLPFKAWVFGVRVGDAATAYPVLELSRARAVNDVVGGQPVVLVAGRGPVAVRGIHRDGDFIYLTGAEVRAYDRGERTFTWGPTAGFVTDDRAEIWKVTESGLVAPDGRVAPRIDGQLAYWFAWYSFFSQTDVWEPAP